MKYRINIFLSILCLVLFSCRSKEPPCSVKKDDLILKFPALYKAGTADSRVILGDIGLDSIVGGYYSFYGNGSLKEYSFYIDSNVVIYKEQFDSLGNLMYKFGEPSLYRKASVQGDSVVLNIFLFTLNKTFTNSRLSINNKFVGTATLLKDSLFSNTELARFVFKRPETEQLLNGRLSFEYKSTCTGQTVFFTDSVLLQFKPPASLSNIYPDRNKVNK